MSFQGLPCAIVAVAFMTFMNVVFMFPTNPVTDAPDMNYTCTSSLWPYSVVSFASAVVICGIMLLSVVWYYFPVYGGVHWFKGPISTVDHEDERASGPQSIDSKDDSSLKQGDSA